MQKPELSILVTSYKNPQLLKLCLESIQKHTQGIDYEIVVADSATEEETRDLMREKFPKITFFPHRENAGTTKLWNQVLRVAKGEYIFIINGDIILKNKSVDGLLDFFKKNPSVGLIGPKLINFDNSIQQSCFRFYSPLAILFRRTFLGKLPFGKRYLERFLMKQEQAKNKNNEPIETDWIMGSAMMTKQEAIKKVGLFDQRFFMYFEDVDWCWRFWQNGYKVVYYPKVEFSHYHGKGSAVKGGIVRTLLSNKLAWIHIWSALKFFSKHWGEKNPHKT